MSARRLLSTRRRVRAERSERYDLLWDRLRQLLADRGAHAWRFRSAANPELFLEFVEFSADADPRGVADVESALSELAGIAGGGATAAAEEWEEVRRV